MKKWPFVLALALLAWCMNVFPGTEIGTLSPVELAVVSCENSLVTICTDTGEQGVGDSVASAAEDLARTASGTITLQTADYVLVDVQMSGRLTELLPTFRSAVEVCALEGQADLEAAASFLRAHEPGVTLRSAIANQTPLPTLTVQEGRMRLA